MDGGCAALIRPYATVATQSIITRRAIVRGVAASVGLAMAAASGDIVGAARAQSAPRTFVLVHGTLVAGWCWRRLSDLLEKKGHKVFSPTLMGSASVRFC